VKKLHSVQARLWGVVFAALMATHGAAMAQGSAQTNPGETAATAATEEPKESLLAAFGPIALAGLAVMTLLVRRRPMR
jgi:hypothetical protein